MKTRWWSDGAIRPYEGCAITRVREAAAKLADAEIDRLRRENEVLRLLIATKPKAKAVGV